MAQVLLPTEPVLRAVRSAQARRRLKQEAFAGLLDGERAWLNRLVFVDECGAAINTHTNEWHEQILALQHVGDANGYVSVYRAGTDRIALVGEGVHFKASTGELLREDPPRSAVASVNEFLTGLHLQHFRHWLLRGLYLFGGLMGCVCIATGFVFFVEKRKKQHARQGSQGSRVVDALAVTTVTGMLVAALGMLIGNRLLPDTMPAGWPARGDMEQYLFWGCWVLAMAHAFVRSAPVTRGLINPAWREQCWAVAAMAVLAVGLNWVTTGDHLIKTLSEGYWPVAGVDLFLLGSSVLALVAARHLKLRTETVSRTKQVGVAHV